MLSSLAAISLCTPILSLVNALVRNKLGTVDGDLPSGYLKRPAEPGPIPANPAWGLTVVIMGYMDQPHMISTACHHGSMWPLVEKVLVVWNSETETWNEDVDCDPGSIAASHAEIHVLPQKHNTLLNKYAVWPEIVTEAVLLLDDDIIVKDVDELHRLYYQWRNHPKQVIGYKGHCPYLAASGYVYDTRDCEGQVSMLTGQANMLHRNYMQLFMARQPDEILKSIYTESPTCEDMALHFLVSNMTGLPPLRIRDAFEEQEVERGEMQDSMHDDWWTRRSACLDTFTRIYGRYPLVGALPPP